jgi:uncharacterized protein (TIGR02246 family)
MKHLIALSTLFFGFISVSFSQYSNQDEKALYGIVQTMQQGWNAKSGKQFASNFASPHDYIVWNGMYFNSQTTDNNAEAHQALFDSFYKNTDVRLKIDKIRPIREDLVTVHLFGATYERGTPVPENPKVIITLLIEKQKEGWKIISFHNSDIEISFEGDATSSSSVPLQEMFKSWYKS